MLYSVVCLIMPVEKSLVCLTMPVVNAHRQKLLYKQSSVIHSFQYQAKPMKFIQFISNSKETY